MNHYNYKGTSYTIKELSEMSEEWKPIFGYEDHYEVSSSGRVRSITRTITQRNRFGRLIKYQKEGRILKQHDRNGYLAVQLCKDGIETTQSVHRLVATTFIDNPLGLQQVNHKDENKHNNSVDNLEWCTCKDNQNYGTRNIRLSRKLSGEKNAKSRLSEEDVHNIRYKRKQGVPLKTIAEYYGISTNHVYQIASGKRWKHV